MGRGNAADARDQQDRRGPFEKFVEAVYERVSRAPFFVVIVAALALWAASYPLWPSTTKWEIALHTGAAILSLLLLVLLENAGRRTEEATQAKLNVIAEALSDLMESRGQDDPELREAAQRLRDASGLEQRH